MSEETPTVPEEDKKSPIQLTDEEIAAQQAEAARRIMDADDRPNYTARRVGAAIFAGSLLAAGWGVAQVASNEIQKNDRIAAIDAEYDHNEAILDEIEEKALDPVDPASIVGIFEVAEGTTVDQLSIDVATKRPEYQQADEATQDWIDFSLLKSGIAQGSYDVGDTFVVSRTTIGGKDTLIVQDGEGVELPTLPSPITE